MKTARRAASGKAGRGTEDAVAKLMAFLSPTQRAFVEDSHRFKVACCGRRSGKTIAGCVYMIIKCISAPKTPCLYLGLTAAAAKNAAWDELITLLDGVGIRYEPRVSTMTIAFPNGSSIRLFGADAVNAKARLRGTKYALIVVDETGFYAQIDPLLVALTPTLADLRGTMVMSSSPGELQSGLFYEAYAGTKKADWSQHHWTIAENPWFQAPANDPAFEFRWQEELDVICRTQFGGNRSDPAFRREYLGEYVADTHSLVYPMSAATVVGSHPLRKAQRAIGVAFGLGSSVGIVEVAYSDYSKDVLITRAETGLMSPKEVADRVREWDPDGKATQLLCHMGTYGEDVVAEMQRRYELPYLAVKGDSADFYQAIFREDLAADHIRCLRGLPIISEWSRLVRGADGVEIPGQPNLMSLAALSVYKVLYNSHLKAVEVPETDDQIMERQLVESARAEKEAEDEFKADYGLI